MNSINPMNHQHFYEDFGRVLSQVLVMECPFGSSTVDVVLGHLSDLEILPRSVYNLFWSFPKLVGGLKYFEISQSDFLGDPSTYFFLYLVGGDWNHGMDYDFPETLGNGKSSQLSLIFFRGVGIPPTSKSWGYPKLAGWQTFPWRNPWPK